MGKRPLSHTLMLLAKEIHQHLHFNRKRYNFNVDNAYENVLLVFYLKYDNFLIC